MLINKTTVVTLHYTPQVDILSCNKCGTNANVWQVWDVAFSIFEKEQELEQSLDGMSFHVEHSSKIMKWFLCIWKKWCF